MRTPAPTTPSNPAGHRSPRTRRLVTLALSTAVLVSAAAVFGMMRLNGSTAFPAGASAPAGKVVSKKQLADDYGIRLNLVGVTAAGGLVDLRFTITDASKARRLFTDATVMPGIVVERSGAVLQAPHGGRHHSINPTSGASYFVLIGNAGGAVQRGVPVSVLINGVRVEHITAQS